MKQTLKGSILISGEGRIITCSGHIFLKKIFISNCFFIDRVHLSDRIVVLTFFDTLRRTGNAEPVLFRLQYRGIFINHCILIPGKSGTDEKFELFLETETDCTNLSLPENTDKSIYNQNIPLIAAAAHEMRTPLSAIIGFSDILLHEEKNTFKHEIQREYILLIKKTSEHLLETITDMLDTAQPCPSASGSKNDIDTIIHDCISMMSGLLSQRNITLKTSGVRHQHVAASDIHIRQIVINLLSNAIKYTGQNGHIILDTSVKIRNYVVLSVKDNGIGINRKQLACIRIPFQRTENALNSPVEGHGLGLSLVCKIADSYGGKVKIKSRPGKGTDVSVFLPLTDTNGRQKKKGIKRELFSLLHKPEIKNYNTDDDKKDKEICKSA